MRLPAFISQDMEGILQEFEDFARTSAAVGASMEIPALRDHAAAMLEAIVTDLGQPRSPRERERKGKGDGPSPQNGLDTAAHTHGHDRAGDSFTLRETVATGVSS